MACCHVCLVLPVKESNVSEVQVRGGEADSLSESSAELECPGMGMVKTGVVYVICLGRDKDLRLRSVLSKNLPVGGGRGGQDDRVAQQITSCSVQCEFQPNSNCSCHLKSVSCAIW